MSNEAYTTTDKTMKQQIKEITLASDEFSLNTWDFIGNRPHREFIVTKNGNSLLVAVWTDIVDGAFVHYSVIYNNKTAIFTSGFFCVDDYPVSSDEAVKAAIEFLNK